MAIHYEDDDNSGKRYLDAFKEQVDKASKMVVKEEPYLVKKNTKGTDLFVLNLNKLQLPFVFVVVDVIDIRSQNMSASALLDEIRAEHYSVVELLVCRD
jgi:predicted PolB exonuclease-like 3'-5' exonuclease